MIDGLKPYPKYKDSGVPWLGKVPEHWEVRKLRHILRQRTERNQPQLPLLSVVREKGVILRDIDNRDTNHNYIPDDLSNYKVVRAGQFAMNKMKAWQGSYGVSRFDGIVSPAYFVFDLARVGDRYFHLAIRSKAYIPFFNQASNGVRIGQWDLSQARMREIPFFIPPLPEQTAIVRFLDWAGRRIRLVIRARQRRIKLLEEYKQALINQIVTGKINVRTGKPYPKYKDSGVEWLDKVPEHWEVKPVKRFYEIQLGKMLQRTKKSDDDFFVPYLKAIHVQWSGINTYNLPKMWASPCELSEYSVRPGDLLVCEGGEGGRCAIVRDVQGTVIIQNALHRVRPREKASNEYLLYCMKSIANIGWFDVLNDKATIAHFTREKFAALEISVPPLPEQTAIVEFLDERTAKIDTAISATHREIDLLEEFRTRLIADVVTGKLDVREAKAKLPDEPPEEEAEPFNEEVKSKNDIEIRVPEYGAVSWEDTR